jgi:hypothetical protein
MSSNGLVEQIYKVTHPTPSTHRRSPNPPYKYPVLAALPVGRAPAVKIPEVKVVTPVATHLNSMIPNREVEGKSSDLAIVRRTMGPWTSYTEKRYKVIERYR